MSFPPSCTLLPLAAAAGTDSTVVSSGRRVTPVLACPAWQHDRITARPPQAPLPPTSSHPRSPRRQLGTAPPPSSSPSPCSLAKPTRPGSNQTNHHLTSQRRSSSLRPPQIRRRLRHHHRTADTSPPPPRDLMQAHAVAR
jgi:hypothetical protein